VPYYPYWSIFDKEGDTFRSELTCFWNIANLLNATTGTVEFLEKAIERWETVEVPHCIGLQTKEERTQEIFEATQYTNSPPYRTSWEQWIQAAAHSSQALAFLAKNGLFQKMYEDQLNERRNREFQKSQDKHKKNKTQAHNPPKEQNSQQNSQKRARSKSQTGGTPSKQPNISKDWNNRAESSYSHDTSWKQGHGNWQQGWASVQHRASGHYSHPNVSTSSQQDWQTYSAASSSQWPAADASIPYSVSRHHTYPNVSTNSQQSWYSHSAASSSHWPSTSSSSSGSAEQRNTQTYSHREVSENLAPPYFNSRPPKDHFQ
jgi:hypothetical protein